MRRFDKWARENLDDIRAYVNLSDYYASQHWGYADSTRNPSLYQKFYYKGIYEKILDTLSNKDKCILNEYVYRTNNKSYDKYLFKTYCNCDGNLRETVKDIKYVTKNWLENRNVVRHNCNKYKNPLNKLEVIHHYTQFLKVFKESLENEFIGSYTFKCHGEIENVEISWYLNSYGEFGLDVFLDRNSLFSHEDEITLLSLRPWHDNCRNKTKNIGYAYGKLSVLKFLCKFSKIDFEKDYTDKHSEVYDWFSYLESLFEDFERRYYDDDYVDCPVNMNDIKLIYKLSKATVEDVYPNVNFVKGLYPSLSRSAIVSCYRGFDSLEGLEVGTKFTSESKEYIVIDRNTSGRCEIITYVNVKTKVGILNTIPEDDLNFGMSSYIINECWDALYLCNRYDKRRKYQRDVKIVA